MVAEELLADDEQERSEADEPPAPAEGRFHLSRPQISAFITQARVIVAAGRPPCPYCGRPFDPVSGFCPCAN